MTRHWWQLLPGGPRRLGGGGDVPEARVRYVTTAVPVAGGSFGASYQRLFGNTTFCAPIPQDPPDARPDDPFIAGRRVYSGQIDPATRVGYPPWWNTTEYNLPTFLIDTTLPPGPVESGGGGYTFPGQGGTAPDGTKAPDLWQIFRPNYYLMRGGGIYQPWTVDFPVPVGFRGASGTDESASVIDIGTMKAWDFWHVRTSDGTIENFRWAGYRDGPSGVESSYPYAIPAGAQCYYTMGIIHDLTTSTGTFDRGNVVASGMIGSAFQVSIDEACMAAGVKVNPDGSFSNATPILDAIQHVIGVEYGATFAEGPARSWPANFSDAYVTPANEILYGQRQFFDPSVLDEEPFLSAPPFIRALIWTGVHYGFVATDKGGNFALRGEFWFDPGDGRTSPWTEVFGRSGGKASIVTLPWAKLRSLPKDFGMPGTGTAGMLSPLGIPA